MSQPLSKNAIIQRIRRKDARIAERLKSLPEAWLQSPASSPANKTWDTVTHSYQSVNNAIQRALSGEGNEAEDLLLKELSIPLKMAQALSRQPPSAQEIEIDSAIHFQHLSMKTPARPDALTDLQQVYRLVKNKRNDSIKSVDKWLSKADTVFRNVDQALDQFSKALQKDFDVQRVHSPLFSLLKINPEDSSRYSPDWWSRIARSGRDVGTIIYSEDDDGVRIHHSTNYQGETGAPVSFDKLFPDDWSISQANNEVRLKLNSEDIGPGYDYHLMKTLMMSSPTAAPTVALTISDLSDWAQWDLLAREVSSGTQGAAPAWLRINSQHRLLIDTPGGRSISTLGNAITDGQDITIALGPNAPLLTIPYDMAKIWQEHPQLWFTVDWSPGGLVATGLRTQEQAVKIPMERFENPAFKRLQQNNVKNSQSGNKGYIQNEYNGKARLRLLQQQGNPSELARQSERNILDMLNTTGRRAIVGLDVFRDATHDAPAIGVQMRLYSKQGDRLHIRDLNAWIAPERSGLIVSQNALASWGWHRDQLEGFGETPAEVDKLLSNALNRAAGSENNMILLGDNIKAQHRALQKTCPETFSKLNNALTLDRQQLRKKEGLSSHQRELVTLYAGKGAKRPIPFQFTPGARAPIEKLCNGEITQCFSDDGQYLLDNSDGDIYITEIGTQTQGVWGSASDLRKHLLSHTQRPSYNQNTGDVSNLLWLNRVTRWVRDECKSVPVKPTKVDSVSLPDSKDRDPSITDSIIHTIKSKWQDFGSEYRFEQGVEANIDSFIGRAGFNDMANIKIAGGIGGQTGKRFLQDLQVSHPELFEAAVFGKKTPIDNISGTQEAGKVSAEQGSVTVRDYIRALAFSHQRENSKLVQAYHQVKPLSFIFQQTTPNSPTPRDGAMDMARKLGVSQRLLFNTFKKAKALWEMSPRSYQLNPDGIKTDSSVQVISDIEHLSQWKENMGSASLKSESWLQSAKSTLESIALPIIEEEYPPFANLPHWADHRAVVALYGSDREPESNPPISDLMKLLYISNGQHNAVPKSLTFSEDERKRFRRQWNKVMHQKTWRGEFDKAREWMSKTGTEQLSIEPSPHSVYKWLESKLLSPTSKSGHRLTPGPLPVLMNLKHALPDICREIENAQIPGFDKVSSRIDQVTAALNRSIEVKVAEIAIISLHEELPGNTVLASDPASEKNGQLAHAEESGIQFHTYSAQDLTSRLALIIEERFPDHPGLKELYDFAENGNEPKKGSAGRDVVDNLRKHFRQMPIPAHVPKQMKHFAHGFLTSCDDPASVLLNDNSYLKLWQEHHDRPVELRGPDDNKQAPKTKS